MRLSRVHPNYNGWPAPISELQLPESKLNPEVQNNFNNHHRLFTERDFGRHVISLTCRNLNYYQEVMPKDLHMILHDRYEPAPMPDMVDMMDRLDEAFQNRELLRYGSALHPIYRVIDMKLWRSLTAAYNELDIDKEKTIIT